jgi:hypothetical protein
MRSYLLSRVFVFLAAIVLSLPTVIFAAPEDFLGKWEGVYEEGNLSTTLNVEIINGNEVSATYGYGTSKKWGIKPGERKVPGKFIDDGKSFFLELRHGITVTYILNRDGTLTAEYYSRKFGKFYATMRKKN